MELSFEEWSELVALEAPSIWGLAVAKADVLDISEPTFPSEELTESEAATDDPSDISMHMYSPSPVQPEAFPVLPGFNLVRSAPLAEAADVACPCEVMAVAALAAGWISEPELMQLVHLLPTCFRPFQRSSECEQPTCLFTTGAYIRGPMAGVMTNVRSYPAA